MCTTLYKDRSLIIFPSVTLPPASIMSFCLLLETARTDGYCTNLKQSEIHFGSRQTDKKWTKILIKRTSIIYNIEIIYTMQMIGDLSINIKEHVNSVTQENPPSRKMGVCDENMPKINISHQIGPKFYRKRLSSVKINKSIK